MGAQVHTWNHKLPETAGLTRFECQRTHRLVRPYHNALPIASTSSSHDQIHTNMKFFSGLTIILASLLTAEALSIPNALQRRDGSDISLRDVSLNDLFKRKGGGGGGRGGGGGSSSSSSSSGSSGGGRTSSSSNIGGSTASGSGAARSYGGGAYYGGGATVPYRAGDRSTKGIRPVGLLPVAGLAFFPGLWLYGAYMYPYGSPYHYYNRSANRNESKPVTCLCQEYQPCGCDDNNDGQFLNQTIGNGTNLNSSLVQRAVVNGTDQFFINGSLPNGTTAPGGEGAGMSISGQALSSMGWAVMGTLVTAAMWSL